MPGGLAREVSSSPGSDRADRAGKPPCVGLSRLLNPSYRAGRRRASNSAMSATVAASHA